MENRGKGTRRQRVSGRKFEAEFLVAELRTREDAGGWTCGLVGRRAKGASVWRGQ